MPRQGRQGQGRQGQGRQGQGRQQEPFHTADQFHGRPFPAQDTENSIPFYNARLFSMYESLIQSYTHFTYHANHMYNVLEQVLHGTRNSINSNPYPWLLIPHPREQPQPREQPHPREQPLPREPPRQPQQPQPPRATTTNLETNIMNALFGMINAPEERRLTPEQLSERVETVVFRNIINPINNVCSITHDVFEPTQRVARIRHCGHIFNSDSLAHWLRMNNTCPTCRHNLLTDARRVQEPEININSIYNELLRTSRNIPGFELNSVDDDSIIFSFDLMNNGTRTRTNGSGTGSGATGSGATGGTDDVD